MTQDLGRYLGVPVLHDRITRRTYQPIFERLDAKLSGWKASSLSLAGRITLALSILNAIPAYAMQTSVLPSHICEKIDQKIRNFVWGSSDNCRKLHLVSWDTICKPKDRGGLGLRKTKEGLRMGLRDGVSTNFWQNRWTDFGERLIDSVLGDHSAIDTDQPVSAFVSNTGVWNWSLFSHLLTPGARLQVAGMSPLVSGAGEDQITWGLEGDVRFRIRSAYSLVAEDVKEPREGFWKIIWRWKGPQRIRQFLWLVAHHRLLTNGVHRRRHLTEIGACQVCPEQEETVLHVLRDCPLASATWELLAFPSDNLAFFQTPLLPWIEDFIRRPELSLLFGVTCWFLWRYRNDRVFNGKLTTAVTLTRHIQAWVA
ncbi:Putative ribonuclease H protein At1g65750 [Linum perenne]